MSFLGEMKRRKVFQVAAVYAVVGWLLIQISSVIKLPLNLPDYFDTLVIVLVGIGFPIALIMSWVFDVAPGGLVVTDAERQAVPAAQAPAATFTYVIQGLVLAAVVFLIADQYLLDRPATDITPAAATAPRFAGQARFSFVPPEWRTEEFGTANRVLAGVDISPDGLKLAYSKIGGAAIVDLAALHRLDTDADARTEIDVRGGIGAPMFSPDSGSLVLLTTSQNDAAPLARVNADGSGADEIAYADDDGWLGWGVSLGRDGQLYFGRGYELVSMPVSGNNPRVIVSSEDEDGFLDGSPLPDGEHLLVSRVPEGGRPVFDAQFEVRSLATGELIRVLGDGYAARYLPSGHVVYVFNQNLYAQRFDLDTLVLEDEPILIANRILSISARAKPSYGFSDDGTLVYATRDETRDEIAGGPRGRFRWFRVSPDGAAEPLPFLSLVLQTLNAAGDKIAFQQRPDLFISEHDLRTGITRPLTGTEDGGNVTYPLYGPNDELLFAADAGIRVLSQNGSRTIIESLEARGAARRTASTALFFGTSDGRIVIRESATETSGDDIGMISRDRPEEPISWLVVGEGDQSNATLSDDERFMAYQDRRAGSRLTSLIYVVNFGDVDSEPIIVGYGIDPTFVGNQLYFLRHTNAPSGPETDGDWYLMSVAFDPAAETFTPIGEPAAALPDPVYPFRVARNYTAGLYDGSFLVPMAEPDAAFVPPRIGVWINFFAWLEDKLPAAQAN